MVDIVEWWDYFTSSVNLPLTTKYNQIVNWLFSSREESYIFINISHWFISQIDTLTDKFVNRRPGMLVLKFHRLIHVEIWPVNQRENVVTIYDPSPQLATSIFEQTNKLIK